MQDFIFSCFWVQLLCLAGQSPSQHRRHISAVRTKSATRVSGERSSWQSHIFASNYRRFWKSWTSVLCTKTELQPSPVSFLHTLQTKQLFLYSKISKNTTRLHPIRGLMHFTSCTTSLFSPNLERPTVLSLSSSSQHFLSLSWSLSLLRLNAHPRKGHISLEKTLLLPPNLTAAHPASSALLPSTLVAHKDVDFAAVDARPRPETAPQLPSFAVIHNTVFLMIQLSSFLGPLSSHYSKTQSLRLLLSPFLERSRQAFRMRPFVRPSLKQVLTMTHALSPCQKGWFKDNMNQRRVVSNNTWMTSEERNKAQRAMISALGAVEKQVSDLKAECSSPRELSQERT